MEENQNKKSFSIKRVLVTVGVIIGAIIVLGIIVGNNSPASSTNSTSTTTATLSPEQIKQDQASLDSLKKTYDDMNKLTTYKDPSSPNTDITNSIYPEIGQTGNGPFGLFLRVSYTGDNWLFVQKYILNADGTTYEIIPSDVQRNNSTVVWEWSTDMVTPDILTALKAVANSNTAKMRYVGQQYKFDREITSSEKSAIKNVLNAYELLSSGQK